MFNKKQKEIIPVAEYETCDGCGHLIKIGSGQRVIEAYPQHRISFPGVYRSERTLIYCKLCEKPYDRTNKAWAENNKEEVVYEKKIEPWKRVNEDGTDYVEKKTSTEEEKKAKKAAYMREWYKKKQEEVITYD